jgi:hypothetical protein
LDVFDEKSNDASDACTHDEIQKPHLPLPMHEIGSTHLPLPVHEIESTHLPLPVHEIESTHT